MQLAGAALHALVNAKLEAARHRLTLKGHPPRLHDSRAGVHPGNGNLGYREEGTYLRPDLARCGIYHGPAFVRKGLYAHLLVFRAGNQRRGLRHLEFARQEDVIGDGRNGIHLSKPGAVITVRQAQGRDHSRFFVILRLVPEDSVIAEKVAASGAKGEQSYQQRQLYRFHSTFHQMPAASSAASTRP